MKKPSPLTKPRNPKPSPTFATLLRGEARELLTTWEVTKNKETIEKRLALCDKKFGYGMEKEIRRLMHVINKEERCKE